MKTYGIGCYAANWIESWVCYRYQRVVLNGTSLTDSRVKRCTTGLHYGSYFVYINDVDVNLNSYMLKHADDAKVFTAVSSLEKVANLQSDLDKFHKWSQD